MRIEPGTLIHKSQLRKIGVYAKVNNLKISFQTDLFNPNVFLITEVNKEKKTTKKEDKKDDKKDNKK